MKLPILVAVVLAGAVASPCRSSPLAVPGDRVLRQDVLLLHGLEAIPGPVLAWPMTWDQLTDSLLVRLTRDELPPHAKAAARRVLDASPLPEGYRLEFMGALTNRRRLIYAFDGGGRQDVDLQVTGERIGERATARLSIGYRSGDEDDEGFVLDGSYLSLALGNWTLFGGAPDRWYGPGEDGGLLLSRNARPVPGIGIFRSVPRRSHLGIIRWMGPWRFEATAGVLTGERGDFSNPLLVNFHFAMEPWSRFEIALSRGIMICGEGRPCDAEAWLRSLFGVFDLDNRGEDDDPSNQNASIALSYTFRPGTVQVSPVVEWFYEDEIDFASVLVGSRVLVPHRDAVWRLRMEYSDTYANRFLGVFDSPHLEPTPGKTYDHFIYTDGYAHQDRVVGHPVGGDGKLITLETGLVGGGDWDVVSRFRYAEVRLNPLKEPEPVFGDTYLAELGGGLPFGKGRVGLHVRWMEDDPFTVAEEAVWEVEVACRFRVDGPEFSP